jgi:hypothetical protein
MRMVSSRQHRALTGCEMTDTVRPHLGPISRTVVICEGRRTARQRQEQDA